MDLKLRVLEGKSTGQEISVQGNKFFVGRSEDCHLRPSSDLISRHHCVLLVEEGYVGVRDFGSKNGTFVNDERVVGERELKPGDRLTIGPLRFEVHIAHGLAAKKRPPVNDIKEAVARTAHDAAQNPLDLDQWLNEETDASAPTAAVSAAASDTATMSDTDSINLSTTQTLLPEGDASAQEPEQTKGKPGGKKTPGKLPPIPNSSKDSQEAAAAMLSKFRKRH
jgi:pSer/pThr/pTyr-binding forkhead associated (FHA) protein